MVLRAASRRRAAFGPLCEQPLEVLFTVPLKRGDGVYLELGTLENSDDGYVCIPYTDKPGVEHKFCLTLYTDLDHRFMKIDPRLNCEQCGNPSGMFRCIDSLDKMMRLTKRVHDKEHRLSVGDGGAPRRSSREAVPVGCATRGRRRRAPPAAC